MGEFFKPWRRKIGCVTLLLACVFTAGWIRSRTVADWVLLFGNTVVVSGGQKFVVVDRSRIRIIHLLAPERRVQTTLLFPHQLTSRFGWGYCTGIGVMTGFDIGMGMLPYWSIVLPLTLISVFLFLTKPHKSTPMKINEPLTEKLN